MELEFDQCLQRFARSGRYFDDQISLRQVELMGFASAVAEVHRQLPAGRSAYLPGRLRQGLQHDAGLRPLALEMSSWGHAQQRGFSVLPTEMLGMASYDFHFAKEGRGLALDCKFIDAEKGLPLKSAQVADLLDGAIQKSGRKTTSRHVRVEINMGSVTDKELSQIVADAISADAAAGRREANGSTVGWDTLSENMVSVLDEARRITNEEKRYSRLAELLSVGPDGHILLIHDDDETMLALSVTSRPRGDIIDTIFKGLRADAKRQLPENLPSALTVELSALRPDDSDFFVARNGGDRLMQAVTDLFERRRHLLAMTFIDGSGHGAITASGNGQARRRALTFVSQSHPLRHDEFLKSFWLGPQSID